MWENFIYYCILSQKGLSGGLRKAQSKYSKQRGQKIFLFLILKKLNPASSATYTFCFLLEIQPCAALGRCSYMHQGLSWVFKAALVE